MLQLPDAHSVLDAQALPPAFAPGVSSQRPSVQWPDAHSVPVAQAAPPALPPGEQTPPAQLPDAQPVFDEQGAPFGEALALASQKPPALHVPEAHSAFAEQAAPGALPVGFSQCPLVQRADAHSGLAAHGAPAGF